MIGMAEIYDIQAFRKQDRFGKEKERPGVRPVAPARGDQVVISFEAERAARKQGEACEGAGKHPAQSRGMRSLSPGNEQTVRFRGALESHIIQELAVIQAGKTTQDADISSQSACAGQELGGGVRAHQEEEHRQLLQKAENNLTAEWGQRNAYREAAGWVYLPELLRYLKQGGWKEEARFCFKPLEREAIGFIQIIFALFFGFLALFADEDDKKSSQTDEVQTA